MQIYELFSEFLYLCSKFLTLSTKKNTPTWRLPAEWEPQWGVQLTWPHAQTDWAPMLSEITTTYEEMAREIAKREHLLVVKQGDYETNDTWARDHGFITLVDDEGHARLLDFRFNGWGEKFPAELDNALNRQLYDDGKLEGEYVDCLDFVLEGGSIESDGKGTVFTTTGCLTAPHRNEPMTQTEIETRLKHDLHAERILWIDHGQLTGDDTDGHIDTLVRHRQHAGKRRQNAQDQLQERAQGFLPVVPVLQLFRQFAVAFGHFQDTAAGQRGERLERGGDPEVQDRAENEKRQVHSADSLCSIRGIRPPFRRPAITRFSARRITRFAFGFRSSYPAA